MPPWWPVQVYGLEVPVVLADNGDALTVAVPISTMDNVAASARNERNALTSRPPCCTSQRK